MTEIIKSFCGFGRQKNNIQKSKLFVSQNTKPRTTGKLHHMFGIPASANLGLYLGMSIIHGRKSRNLYEFLLTKVRKRLNGLKKKPLFKAARCILIQSLTSSLPSYEIHTILLPKGLLNELESLNRRFLWTDEEQKKKCIWWHGM